MESTQEKIRMFCLDMAIRNSNSPVVASGAATILEIAQEYYEWITKTKGV